jgi:hypothetical protein
MKKLLVILAYLSISTVLIAQEDSEPGFKLPRTVLKISPFQFIVSTLELGIEAFNPAYSRSFNFSAGFRSGSFDYDEGNGASLELGYRKYAAPMKYRARGNRESYQGVYYSLFVRGEYFKGEDSDYYYSYPDTYTEKIFSIAPGFTIGFQKTLWQVILLDAYVGGGIKFSDVEYLTTYDDYVPYYTIYDPGYSGIFPKIGVKIGIAL